MVLFRLSIFERSSGWIISRSQRGSGDGLPGDASIESRKGTTWARPPTPSLAQSRGGGAPYLTCGVSFTEDWDPQQLVYVPRRKRDLARARRAAARGEVQVVLPNVYCRPETSSDLLVRIHAAMAADPNTVILGRAAARLTWWPDIAVTDVHATRSGALPSQRGFMWSRRRIPPDLVDDRPGLRLTVPVLTVLDLIPELGGTAIDEALRRRAVTLAGLWDALALTPGRRGNATRRALLDDSRDEPWSYAERCLHRHYRALDTPYRYRTNHRLSLSDGRSVAIDLALPDLRLGFEADGYAHHNGPKAFEYDRDRDSDLESVGWRVIRLTATFLEDQGPEAQRRMLAIIRIREAELGLRPFRAAS